MIIVSEAAPRLKAFLAHCDLKPLARVMMMRIVLAFIMHRGRMSCSAAAGAIASEPIHRGELTRFLARPRWQKHDFNEPMMRMLLAKEKKRGKFLFLIDATLVSQVWQENAKHLQHRQPHPAKDQKGLPLQQQKSGPQEGPQLHVRTADHALRHSHPDADPSPNQRILRRARHRAHDDCRSCCGDGPHVAA